MWRKDTIANELDPSSIFIVHNTDDVEHNINMPSQIIVIVQEVHTNMSGQGARREKNEQLNETPHTEMEMDKNGMACDGKKRNVLGMSLFVLCSTTFWLLIKH